MKKNFVFLILFLLFFNIFQSSVFSKESSNNSSNPQPNLFPVEDDLIEVMFIQNSKVRLRNEELVDLTTDATNGLDNILQKLNWHKWSRISSVPEEELDKWAENGERNTGEPIYNMNNIYRLKIPEGNDVWAISRELENLSGIYLAKPVPMPVEPPNPPDYQANQGYLNSSSSTPTGIDALYAWLQTGGTGTGVTVCDIEYSWNYNHADITKAIGSGLNTWTNPPTVTNNHHGTAVIGELVADNNSWGTTGICYGANLLTCGSYYWDNVSGSYSWNVPGAITIAINNLSAGDIILLEQQWDYDSAGGYIPIEWWNNYSPNSQTNNGVYAAIVNAISNGIHVVEAGGNGNVNTDNLTWFGNSGAIIVGAGGAYTGGTYPNGDLQRLSFSSYGSRFDLQGWGENVYTTGYSDLYSSQGVNYYYTATFNGTSSASPIVAGALACAEGYYLANISSTPPTPAYMRTHLATYGTAQVTPPAGNIGPRPDLNSAITNFPNPIDWGDAPQPPYPTTSGAPGASHSITSLYLGSSVDADADGQPTINADGDDLDGNDDEDGVLITSSIYPGASVNLQVTASMAGYLNAWMDFNMANGWNDSGEQIFVDTPLSPGVNNLSFTVPMTAMLGQTYARFRFSSSQGIPYSGYASDGEVEDYTYFIEEEYEELDFGDAPDPNYPTLITNGGAHHALDGVTYLGNQIDAEMDGYQSADALGDDNNNLDDEDGVIFTCPLIPGEQGAIKVTTNAAGTPYFNGWIDFNNDGDWQDAGEQIFLDFPLPAGIHSLNFNVPAGAATGSTFARFRYSTFASLGTTGYAADGEVEDYKIEIIETPDDDCKMHYHQWPDTTWTGIDVRATEPVILADDFLCTESGLINSIHIWGSWKEDMLSEMPTFTLSIWSDNPNGPGGYSQPDELLWTKDYDFTAYTYSIYHTVDEGEYWWDPYTGDWLSPGDWTVWQYDFAIPDSEAFEQVEDSTYWLSVQVFDPMELDFGWKTSVNHWNDDAVWGTDGLDWIELTYPDQHPYYPESIDFAFYVDCTPTPPVVNISTTNDTVCVSWTAVPCANTYTVYSSTDPYATFPSGWTVEQSGITTTTWCEDVSSTNKKFYRITSVK